MSDFFFYLLLLMTWFLLSQLLQILVSHLHNFAPLIFYLALFVTVHCLQKVFLINSFFVPDTVIPMHSSVSVFQNLFLSLYIRPLPTQEFYNAFVTLRNRDQLLHSLINLRFFLRLFYSGYMLFRDSSWSYFNIWKVYSKHL